MNRVGWFVFLKYSKDLTEHKVNLHLLYDDINNSFSTLVEPFLCSINSNSVISVDLLLLLL